MKRALVTGVSSGLGNALATNLAAKGYAVVGVDRLEPVDKNVNVLIVCDFSSCAQLDHQLPVLISNGPYDLVFLNAGVSATGKFEEIPMNGHIDVLRINLETPLVLTNALLAAKVLSGPICFVSSLSHFTGYPGAASYAASKDGLAVYAKSLRRAGIVTTVAYPGPLDTVHAQRHAPTGANGNNRMSPESAAAAIIVGTIRQKRYVFPGSTAKILALSGWLFPALLTRIMHKMLYEKLDRNVW